MSGPVESRAGRRPRPSLAEGSSEPLLRVRNLVKHFPITSGILVQHRVGAVQAVDGVSFDVSARGDARDRRRDRAAARAPPPG